MRRIRRLWARPHEANRRRRFHGPALGGLLLTSLLVHAACQADGDRKGVVVLPGMVESIPYDAYDAHPILGQTLRHPPEGTVPYGARRYHYGRSVEEAKRAGVELRNPVTPDAAGLKRGKWAYDTFCMVCHGAEGAGDGPIIGRFPNPPSLLSPRARTLPDGHLFHVITYGSGIMAPYAVQLPDEDRWRVIHYIRQIQGGQSPTQGSGAPAGTGAAGGLHEGAGGAGGTLAGAAGEGGVAGVAGGAPAAGGSTGAREPKQNQGGAGASPADSEMAP